jgi:hypothetical protein
MNAKLCSFLIWSFTLPLQIFSSAEYIDGLLNEHVFAAEHAWELHYSREKKCRPSSWMKPSEIDPGICAFGFEYLHFGFISLSLRPSLLAAKTGVCYALSDSHFGPPLALRFPGKLSW